MKQIRICNFLLIVLILFFVLGIVSCTKEEHTVKGAMDKVVAALCKTTSQADLLKMDNDKAMAFFSEDELKVLLSRHWMFDVNVPVVVSVMRSSKQKTLPFWLPEAGFIKTEMTVENEQTICEVWQKSFDAGTVGLGISGFENYGLHYYVSVAPENKSDQLVLSNFFPEKLICGHNERWCFYISRLGWVGTDGCAGRVERTKNIDNDKGTGSRVSFGWCFQTSSYPSSQAPDQIMLSWSSDPFEVRYLQRGGLESCKIFLEGDGLDRQGT